MDATRISIERVLELDVPVIWREAAAVVCEAVAAVRRAGGLSDERPRASSCVVTRGGEVVLADEMARTRPETLVVLASHLLETCAEPDRFGAALQSGTFLEFVDDFASRTSPNQRRVAIASLALRALAAEADLHSPGRPTRMTRLLMANVSSTQWRQADFCNRQRQNPSGGSSSAPARLHRGRRPRVARARGCGSRS